MIVTKKKGKKTIVAQLTLLQSPAIPKLPEGWHHFRGDGTVGYDDLLERPNHAEIGTRALAGLRNRINELNPMVQLPG